MSLSDEYERLMALRETATRAVLRAAEAECRATSMESLLRAQVAKGDAEKAWDAYADAATVVGVIDNAPVRVAR